MAQSGVGLGASNNRTRWPLIKAHHQGHLFKILDIFLNYSQGNSKSRVWFIILLWIQHGPVFLLVTPPSPPSQFPPTTKGG